MNRTTDTTYRPSKADAVGIVAFIVIGAAITIATLVFAIGRIVELASPGPISVPVEFVRLDVDAPLGVNGAAVPLAVDAGTVSIAELPAASMFAAWAEPIAYTLTIVVVVACLVLLSRSILRGRVFSKTNTRLVTIGGLVGLLGVALSRFFGNMVANGAIAWLSDRGFSGNAVMSIDLNFLIIVGFAWATVVTAFTIGERLQRETEGLV